MNAMNLWQFADWGVLSKLSAQSLHGEFQGSARVSVLAASACFQLGANVRARMLLALAKRQGATQADITKTLVANIHLALGRAAFLLHKDKRRISNHFAESTRIMLPELSKAHSAAALEAASLKSLNEGSHAVRLARFDYRPEKIEEDMTLSLVGQSDYLSTRNKKTDFSSCKNNNSAKAINNPWCDPKTAEELLGIFGRSISAHADTVLHIGCGAGLLTLGLADLGMHVSAADFDFDLITKSTRISGTSHSPVYVNQIAGLCDIQDFPDHDVIVLGPIEYAHAVKEGGFTEADSALLMLIRKAKKQFFFMPYMEAARYESDMPFKQENVNAALQYYSKLFTESNSGQGACKLLGLVDNPFSKGHKINPIIVWERETRDSPRKIGRIKNHIESVGLRRNIWNRVRYGPKAPIWAGRIWIDPMRVENCIEPDQGINRLHSGCVLDGDWSDETLPIADLIKYQACIDRWKNGISWESTGIIDYLCEKIEEDGVVDGCRSREQLVERYAWLDEIFETVKKMRRLKTVDELTGSSLGERGGILIHIGQANELIFGGGGFHRFAMARVLGLKAVPAQVGCVHPGSLEEYLRLRVV